MIPRGDILLAYTEHCNEGNVSPDRPQYGFTAGSPFGPWYAMVDESVADKVIEAGNMISVIIPRESGDDLVIDLRMHKMKLGQLRDGKLSQEVIETTTVHVIVAINNPLLFSLINRSILEEAWTDAGFLSVSSAQAGTKLDGSSIQLDGLKTEIFHFNLRPAQHYYPTMFGVVFPRTLDLTVQGTKQYLPYKICSHVELDGHLCMQAKGCHKYFPEAAKELESRYRQVYQPCKGHRAGEGRQRRNIARVGADALKAAVAARKAAKKKIPCRHFAQGKCRKSAEKCAFKHPEGETSVAPQDVEMEGAAEGGVPSDSDLRDSGLA
jgi:hypothetical protein